jgi:hypothetical protein
VIVGNDDELLREPPVDLQTVFASVFLLVLGTLFGTWMGRWSVLPSEHDEYICGCRHHYAFHESSTDMCCQQIVQSRFSPTGERLGEQLTRCPCRAYTGKDPYEDE